MIKINKTLNTSKPIIGYYKKYIEFLVPKLNSWPQAQKLAIIVELLLGDIPQRSLFRTPELRRALLPYFQLTQGVSMWLWVLFRG